MSLSSCESELYAIQLSAQEAVGVFKAYVAAAFWIGDDR